MKPTRNEMLYGTPSTRRRMVILLSALLATTPFSAHATSATTNTGMGSVDSRTENLNDPLTSNPTSIDIHSSGNVTR